MTIELDTDATKIAARAKEELERLERQLADATQSAIKGTLAPETVNRLEADKRFAQFRFDAANSEAQRQADALPTEKELTALITELRTDSTLSMQPMIEALETARHHIEEFLTLLDTRDTAIRAWVQKLKKAGIPATGLKIDGAPIHLHHDIGISIGTERITPIRNGLPYVRGAVADLMRRDTSEQALPIKSLLRYEPRSNEQTAPATIRFTRNIGTYKKGQTETTHVISHARASRMVFDGIAELIDGELPEYTPGPTVRVFHGSANPPAQEVIVS